MKAISPNPLQNYIRSLTPLAEDTISKKLPDKFCKFCIVFDGRSESKIRNVLIFLVCSIEGEFFETMSAFAPSLQEDNLSAYEHKLFLFETLQAHEKEDSNGVRLVGDNALVNVSLAMLIGSSSKDRSANCSSQYSLVPT